MKITILHSGRDSHAICFACKTARYLDRAGYEINFYDMLDYPPEFIHNETHLLIMSNSLLNGEANENAAPLWSYLCDESRRYALSNLHYSVLALGQFALPYSFNCALDFHAHLRRHNARLLSPSLMLDMTQPLHFAEWLDRVDRQLRQSHTNSLPEVVQKNGGLGQ
ncbi:flavodoxin domain-containing protein [Oscillatoria amoena NRMC-F 0135]|nr:flavodoxin domain-containing protein [Oscillatoria amoena NRMC-F 0135]